MVYYKRAIFGTGRDILVPRRDLRERSLYPLFFAEEGGGIYQLNKRARQRKADANRDSHSFTLNPLRDLTVQNTRLSNDFIFDHLRRFLGYAPQQMTLRRPANGNHAKQQGETMAHQEGL